MVSTRNSLLETLYWTRLFKASRRARDKETGSIAKAPLLKSARGDLKALSSSRKVVAASRKRAASVGILSTSSANNNQRTGGREKVHNVCKMKSERLCAACSSRFPASRFFESTILSKDGRFFSGSLLYTLARVDRLGAPFAHTHTQTHRFAHRTKTWEIFF